MKTWSAATQRHQTHIWHIFWNGRKRTTGVHQLQRADFRHRELLWHLVLCLRGKLWQFCKSSPAVSLVLLVQSAGWESSDLQEECGLAYYLTTNQSSPVSSSQTLTVKDLLLSNLGQKVRREEFSILNCVFLTNGGTIQVKLDTS